MKKSTPSRLFFLNYLLLKSYHRWRAFLRNRHHPICKKLYNQKSHRFIPKPKGTITVPSLYGFKLIVNTDSDQVIGRSLYYDGTYEEGTLHVLSQCLAQGDTFVDVGSNLGVMALYGSQCVGPSGKVLAFEPEPGIFETLRSNVEMNHFQNVSLFRTALGDSNGTLTIYNSLTNRGASSLIKSDQLSGQGSEAVVKKLDDVLSEKGIDSVQMLKIDVEGWELEVLKGARNLLAQNHAPIICLESTILHPTYKGSQEEIYDFIVNVNEYSVFRLARGKGRKSKFVAIPTSKELPEHDNIFCFLPSHIKKIQSMFV